MVIRTVLLVWMLCHRTNSIYIPSDVEILDGYNMDDSAEYYPSDGTYYEAKSLATGITKSIRNRRSPLYDGLSPPELPSNHKSVQISNTDENGNALGGNHATVRSSDVELIDRAGNIPLANDNSQNLPRPEKQVMTNGDYHRKTLWNDQSTYRNDYSTYHKQSDDDDSLGESTNEGIKARTPRVNFITQPKKNGDDIKERPLFSKLPTTKSRFEKYESGNYELYPSRSYDPYLRRYDRYDDQHSRYNPYNNEDYYLHRRHYDPYDSYSPRMPSYPESYYDYPDRRYDVPEPREYRSIYNNEIFDRPTVSESRPRRIIYYAHLPEIVRAPTSPSSNDYNYSTSSYRSFDRSRYDYPPFPPGPMSSAYRTPELTSASKDTFGYMKRDKKNHQNFPPYQAKPTNSPTKP